MQTLETISVELPGRTAEIQFCAGDVTDLSANEAVDTLIISAFPGDYLPTPRSVIGALYTKGVNVEDLAVSKAVDLLSPFACWLSKPLDRPDLGYKRILCFEPLLKGEPPAVVGDIFRSLSPFVVGPDAIRSVVIPLVAAGDQEADPKIMLDSLLDAAYHWITNGLPISLLKIVIRSEDTAAKLRSDFLQFKAAHNHVQETQPKQFSYDLFISYSHQDTEAADSILECLSALDPSMRIFVDRQEINPGSAWQTDIFCALEKCRHVISLLTSAYVSSKMCVEEFNMARYRQLYSDRVVLVPLYWRNAELPLYMKMLQYIDCREADQLRLRAACEHIRKLWASG